MKKKTIRKLPIPRRTWDLLSPALQETRKRALSVLGRMRQGSTLAVAAKEIGIDPRTVMRHVGKSLAKRADGKYHAKPTDRISRNMVINSRGKQVEVTVPDSKTASIVGRYFNAVRHWLNTGNTKPLAKFKGVVVTDASGTLHVLETDLKRLKTIESARENREFFEIYKTG